MQSNRIIKAGFTLIEILLVIGVIMIMSIIKIRDINEENENMQSKMLASQIKTVADATNAFLVLKYNELSVLSSPGVSCNTGAGTCNITLQNLNNEALLPPNFNNNTILGNPYEIQLKRTGSSPNYMMSGVVLTKGIKNTENTPSLVFLGKVLRDIGRDGGLNKTSGKIIGTANGWSADSALFPVLSGKTGYIGSAVGTLSGAYYVYLRRDGTLPMTGDLNMDGHNIKNVNNLNATGAISTTGNLSAGGTLSVSGNANVNGAINSNQRITGKEIYSNTETYTNNWFRTMGDGGIYFQKYGGGWNMTDANTITAYGGKNVKTTAGFYGGYVKSTGNIEASGNINGGTINSNSRLTTGEFLQINGVANVGAGCSPSGLQGRDSSGALISCVNGVWKTSSISNVVRTNGVNRCGGSGRLPSYAVCPSGYKLTGGGYSLTQWRNDSGRNAPDGAFPDVANNRFVVNAPGGNDSGCFTAYAICVR